MFRGKRNHKEHKLTTQSTLARDTLLLPEHFCGMQACRATEQVIVDQSGRLEMSVTDRRAEKLEAATFHVLADRIRKFRARWNLLYCLPAVDDGLSLWQKAAEIRTKTAEFPLKSKKAPSIGNRSVDFPPIANNARIVHQTFHFGIIELCNLLCVEFCKRLSVVFPFTEDRDPTQPRLSTFEDEELEHFSVVFDKSAPFFIVILDVQRIVAAPITSFGFHFCTFQKKSLPESVNKFYG